MLGIGNAIVDVIACADDAWWPSELARGAMMLIDEARMEFLYGAVGPGTEVSGGSCGNTMAGLASLGGRAPISARCATISSAACSATTCARSASLRTPPRRPAAPRPRAA